MIILGKDIDSHLKICEEASETCPKCNISYKKKDSHDCFLALMEQIKISEGKLKKSESLLGMDYETLKPTCPRDHMM